MATSLGRSGKPKWVLSFCQSGATAKSRLSGMFLECRDSVLHVVSEVPPIFCKDSANERNESLLSDCRVPPILCKDTTIYNKPLCYKEKILVKRIVADDDFCISLTVCAANLSLAIATTSPLNICSLARVRVYI